MLAEAGPHGVVSLVTIRTRPQADVIYTSSPEFARIFNLFSHQETRCPSSTNTAREKQKWYHLPLQNAVSVPITSPFLSRYPCPFFICIAAVHLARTAAAAVDADSTLEVLLASGSAALLLLPPSCSGHPVGGADLGRTYRCGSRRPCQA